jgi:hypothetical protein
MNIGNKNGGGVLVLVQRTMVEVSDLDVVGVIDGDLIVPIELDVDLPPVGRFVLVALSPDAAAL